MPQLKQKGKFWPWVRALIWEKAEELFMQEQARTMECYIKPERRELREGGYFYEAKLIVLRNLYRQRKGLPSLEEEEAWRAYNRQ
ncbi:MAG: hypothetical protein NWE99_11030 [Candidatus Bathyarchaeota archaeon]|nr:hypothetical protein [Candidatus Bathyarchaeota archaeon]